ncbi:oligopeptide/dipeptide ABC transporter, ATPase subunit [Candidatus Vecturithrix granuli]|uniref:Oligopeptide/dipeptide ABC transporter, ATPase subunit n=1 Tax=Vecturithrix granuli TaxID=1499967 RepID=A0A0S6W9D9_VECG1|nr:oligopeptide/dipeptide ABC transporter, ATPase subunit [Candidatus Vecturithrix granuli]
MQRKLLEVRNLSVHFKTSEGIVQAVRDVSFDVEHGESVGIVGESGSGKSVTSLAIMQLIPNPPGSIEQGEVLFEETNLLTLPRKTIRAFRGNRIAMIFQEPMVSLNPIHTAGQQIMEPLRLHKRFSKKAAAQRVLELLELVGISAPEQRIKEYPHQLSGGMRQRVMIAMALACEPKLLIADEPTTALDVTIQAQILNLIKELQAKTHAGVMMITHNLGVVAETCDRVIVMYTGHVVEKAEVKELFQQPLHPYTRGLLQSIPQIAVPKTPLTPIQGTVPNPFQMPSGCSFHPRCPEAMEICRRETPQLVMHDNGHAVRCWQFNV